MPTSQCPKCKKSFTQASAGILRRVMGTHAFRVHGIPGVSYSATNRKKLKRKTKQRKIRKHSELIVEPQGTTLAQLEKLRASNRLLGDVLVQLLLSHTQG